MTTKLQNYIHLAGETAAQVTQNTENWISFLNTASWLYRYSFPDQLMIHAQRPKATACAEYDLWNRRMARYIRRGSKGIGLVTFNRRGYPKMRYVFDIADTGKKNESASLFQWQYKEEYRSIVTKVLEEKFGASGEKGFVYQIGLLSMELANGFWKNHHKDIMRECEGSRLEGLKKQEVSVKFRMAATASISYVILSRCGIEPWQYLKNEYFQAIPDFNTQKTVRVLGAAVSRSSEQVLRTVAVTIYDYEHEKQTAPTSDNAGDNQPPKDSVQEPDESKADTAQKDDIKEPEPAAAETTDSELNIGGTSGPRTAA